jgi:uncharacterized caspase-like protein
MANWAIVIGIDRYWTDRACLKGAVADALRMREWLLDPAGGNVPEENMALILSPLAGEEPAGLDAVDGTYTQIITAVDNLLRRAKGKGDRLYFFYAGHGLTARVNQRDENALVANDFSPVVTTNSLALRSLWEFFETTQFKDQFLFVDACRNMPWEDVEFDVGRWPVGRKRDPGLPPTQQFILYATSPGLKARELREAGNERGAFTEVLLKGLRGAGPAKVAGGPELPGALGAARRVRQGQARVQAARRRLRRRPGRLPDPPGRRSPRRRRPRAESGARRVRGRRIQGGDASRRPEAERRCPGG